MLGLLIGHQTYLLVANIDNSLPRAAHQPEPRGFCIDCQKEFTIASFGLLLWTKSWCKWSLLWRQQSCDGLSQEGSHL